MCEKRTRQVWGWRITYKEPEKVKRLVWRRVLYLNEAEKTYQDASQTIINISDTLILNKKNDFANFGFSDLYHNK